jgi:fumarylpyruvate hydrolase
MTYVFPPADQTSLAIDATELRFPLHRIYCVGRNYAAHAREMGSDPLREPPFFFTKPADAIVPCYDTISTPVAVPYPPRTRDLQHEIELVVAIGTAGSDIAVSAAESHIFGYAVGFDLTRRDLQQQAKDTGRPWDTGKSFDYSAPISAIHPVEKTGILTQGAISARVNDMVRQHGDLADMIWDVNEVISELSSLFTLQPGDLIFTGTPAGVGAVQHDDVLCGQVEGLDSLCVRIE